MARFAPFILTACFVALALPCSSRGATEGESPAALAEIRVSDDGTHFVAGDSGERFIVWGVNYDHDGPGRLIEDYWHDEWETVVEDFREIKALGANVVRIHLQLPKFMESADRPNEANLAQLARLVELAEETGLYLDITGLGCYHQQDVPEWYDALDEAARWQVQARFWREVAKVGRESPAIFCYDLMNEPILGGGENPDQWLAGAFGDKYFVQRITLDLAGRTREEVARAWVETLTRAIREVDERHMITVGVIPWAQVFKGAKPLFYAPEAAKSLDFVSVHFYPKKGQQEADLAALKVYEIGKPLVIEEIFPLSASLEETDAFIEASRPFVDGWISFYWGTTIDEYKQQGDMKGAIVGAWLEYFERKGAEITARSDAAR